MGSVLLKTSKPVDTNEYEGSGPLSREVRSEEQADVVFEFNC